MATDELGKLSPEQIQKLANTISEAKNLTSQQEEIIQRVIAGETEIGKLRIASLEEYFDIYSRNLDLVARKHSALNDAFLILDRKLTNNFKTLSAEFASLEQRLAETDKPSSKPEGNKSPQNTVSNNTKALVDTALHMLADAYRKESEERAKIIGSGNSALLALEKQHQEQRYTQIKQHLDRISSLTADVQNVPVTNATANNQPVENNVAQVPSENVDTSEAVAITEVTDAIRNITQYVSSPNQSADSSDDISEAIEKNVTNLAALFENSNEATDSVATTPQEASATPASTSTQNNTESTIEDNRNDDSASEALNIADIFTAISDMERARSVDWHNMSQDQLDHFDAIREKHYNKEAELNVLRESMYKLELARSQKKLDVEMRAADAQIAMLQKVTDAEIKAQNLLNDIDQQLSEIDEGDLNSADLSEARARGVDAEADTAAATILLKQMADLKKQLDDESKAKNGGKLSEEDAAKNDAKVRDTFNGIKRNENGEVISVDDGRTSEARLARIKQNEALKAANPKEFEANEVKKAALIAKLELQHKKKNHGKIDALTKQAIAERAELELELSEENLKKLQKQQLEQEKEAQKKKQRDHRQKTESAVSGQLSAEHSLLARIKELKTASNEKTDHDTKGEKLIAALDTAVVAVSSMLAQLDKAIDDIASYKGDIDTRLQGSKNEQAAKSYWNQLTKDMMSVGAVTPYFKQEDFAKNIRSLVDRGIAFDLKQRAFLMTIQEKIANTFEVADGTLLRLIRIQQEDSTAGRLGMESALNSFLNNMYENTEYLKDVAASVRGSLQEMEALMAGAEATEVEYQVQKWMGSLYSVGMSQDAVQGIATALGQIAAGQVDALTNGNGAGNLLVMAANKSGKSISEILNEGLNAEETNKLLQAAVNYLAELAESSKDSKVVQQQLASVYGVKASDLRAAVNLASDGSTDNIFGEYLTYDNMLKQLNDMAGTMHLRTSLGEMMTNIWANGQYTLASSMANNPVAYLLYKMASLLEDTTGGIAIPAISAAGFGVDLETTVADLMRVASISTGIMGSIGPMISGLASSFSGQSMLNKMGISQGSGLKVNVRGTGEGVTASEGPGGGTQSLSESGYVGNSSGSDIKDSTMQESEDTKKQHMIEALEEEQAHQIDYINENVLKIYELLDEVTNGKRSFNVKVAGYGLTGLNSNTQLVGSQGGAGGQLNIGSNSGSSNNLGGGFGGGSSSGSSGSGNSSTSASGNSDSGYTVTKGLDLGGWTIM